MIVTLAPIGTVNHAGGIHYSEKIIMGYGMSYTIVWLTNDGERAAITCDGGMKSARIVDTSWLRGYGWTGPKEGNKVT